MLAAAIRLARAGRVLARHDGLMTQEQLVEAPWLARLVLRLGRLGAARPGDGGLAAALTELGPSYIKLGQFLSTRPDIVGEARAAELRVLQDRMPPFSMEEASEALRAEFKSDPRELFAEFGPPVAAASIAQVHRAATRDGRAVAVKILRPGIERHFARDLESFSLAARLAERLGEEPRRLRPAAAVDTLARSVALEMDLRMEAAAIAEMAQNTAEDPDFRVPIVDWTRTGRRVLTVEWIDGTPLSDLPALAARGIDLKLLAETIIQCFLRQAIRDGFFHADMHQGNLFVAPDGALVAVDFGIMGRLSPRERRFLADILLGFIRRDYADVARVHFEAGYVPAAHDPMVFAQALRAIGEPIMGRPAAEISMARLLAQLFEVTGQFDMPMQPRLLLLQKTMVVVEGVARRLDPDFNMWLAAEPVVRPWIEQQIGPRGQIEGASQGAMAMARLAAALPDILTEARMATSLLAGMAATGGLRLDRGTTEALAAAQARRSRFARYALIAGAIALAAMAFHLIL